MSERLNRTSICSIVFLDIAEYSQKPVSEQIECKEQFNRLISEAIENVAQNDRIILDTGDGAAIALLGAPEEALFVSLTIRDGILRGNQERTSGHLFVRIGINLGPVRVVRDINEQLSIIGDGINVAQRVMSFAQPNQILVSRSYYEIVSRLSEEFTQMFTYSGIKQDKHVREHEIYMIRPSSDPMNTIEDAADEGEHGGASPATNKGKARKLAMAGGLMALLIGGAVMLSKPKHPVETAATTKLPDAQPQATMVAQEPKPIDVRKEEKVATPAVEKVSVQSSEDKAKKTSRPHKVAAKTKKPDEQRVEYKPVESNKPEPALKTVQQHHHEEAKDHVGCTIVQRSLNQCQ